MLSENPVLMHATAVAFGGHAALILGRSGAGKSALALQLIALGCDLVADDQCHVSNVDGALQISAPPSLPNLIEARGIGLLKVPMVKTALVQLVVDLDQLVAERLPADRTVELSGQRVKVIGKVDGPHFPSTILLYLKHIISS